ncbi:N-acetylglucosamine-6-phosphate deacetylase [Paenibacillus thermotolerans]|uniref:N-acetylglucosamine-6-phosphate deacetylase n=1 Tax=Paenibacillus thermotolerans TaxID=3027807 RepID=UPI0023684E66|nr:MULTISPECIES: N-acetylglucosamine-6-phosphate deacetylase [unclassified Paenibacillus]
MTANGNYFFNAKLYAPEGPIEGGWMLITEEGKIAATGPKGKECTEAAGADKVDCEGGLLLPGFIDVHVHGGGGFSVMEGLREQLEGMSAFHAAHGTTSFLATTTTASHDSIVKVLDAASSAVGSVSGADLCGIHLEGPFIHPKRRGTQALEWIAPPSVAKLEEYIRAARGTIRIVSMAPELEGGLEAVRFLTAQGITVSAGHTNATFEEMAAAVANGVSHTTHHFNGMSPLHHREPGVAGAGLMLPQLTTELICDGIHVHPAAVRLLYQVKGPESICMITDAVTCAGLPDGEYGSVIMKQGEVKLADGTTLAGSALTMIAAFRNVLRFTGLPPEAVLPAFTGVPARQAGLSDRKGSLAPGKDADFLLLDREYRLKTTYVRGKAVYRVASTV